MVQHKTNPLPPQKKLFLLDAFALIYRAHFAFAKKPQINSKGHNTSIPFGFTNTLLEVIQHQQPSHIGIAFDTPQSTFRDELFAEYKANREKAPEEVQRTLPIVKDIIQAFHIPIFEKGGYEADDVIGTVATRAAKEGFKVYIMSSDKDLGQLVTENILLYKPAYMGNAVHIMGVEDICNKWNIDRVSQVIDMLGLQGDSSDNIPGVPGIGPKTAARLLKQYCTVEELIAHAHQLEGRQKEKILQYSDQAMLSKQLATIAIDVPISFDEKELRYGQPDEKKLRALFDELEFKRLTQRMFGSSATPPKTQNTPANMQVTLFDEPSGKIRPDEGGPVDTMCCIVDTPEARATLIDQLMQQPEFVFEAVTEGSVHADFELIGLSYYFSKNNFYVPIDHRDKDKARAIVHTFAPVFASQSSCKIGHHIKRSIVALLRYGVCTKGPIFDTMLAHYLLDAERLHTLEALASHYLDISLFDAEDEIKTSPQKLSIILPLSYMLRKELEQKGHAKLMSDMEVPLILVLADMEAIGITVDEQALKSMSGTLRKESENTRKAIYDLAGMEFNIASPKQVGDVLFDKLKLIDKPKKTKTGQYVTSEEVLKQLSSKHAIVQKMLEFRACEKLRSTYVDALPKLICRSDLRIRTDYRQTTAATGRLSSVNPNLQNIPIRTVRGRQIRKAFIPPDEDHVLLSADYSQIELRIAASFAKDATMIEAFRIGRDIHTTAAAKVFHISPEEVTPEMRRKAKEVNFGILYGSGPFGLAQNLNITRTEAAEIITSYFDEFSAIKDYIRYTVEQAKEKGYVETILGRRRYLRDINSRNASARNFAERNAVNAPIQGSAADIIKIAMLHIHSWLQRKNLKTKMLLQVHDELIFYVPKQEQDIVKPKVIELMEHAVVLDVPMKVEAGVGKNWLEAH